MQTQFYFPSPVEVVKVTPQNLEEVAEWCGGKVASTESKHRPGQLDSYVWVPTPKGTSISSAFPGMYVTKRLVPAVSGDFKTTYAVFRRDYFERSYFDSSEKALKETWEKVAKKDAKKPVPTPPKKVDNQAEKWKVVEDESIPANMAMIMNVNAEPALESIQKVQEAVAELDLNMVDTPLFAEMAAKIVEEDTI